MWLLLYKGFVDISYEDSHTHIRRLYVAAAYVFLKRNFFLVFEMFFLIAGTLNYFRVLQNLLYFHYCLCQPLWKIHGNASINFDCFTTGKSNQVNIFREIMRCQGYFFEIVLETRVYKFGMVYTLLSRCFCICSEWKKYHAESTFLKKIFRKNDSPENFIDKFFKSFWIISTLLKKTYQRWEESVCC